MLNYNAKNLENSIFAEDISTQTIGVDKELKYKINRKVSIDGVVHWIRAANEQEYADKIIGLSRQSYQSTAQPIKHNFREYALSWFQTYSAPNVATVTATTYDRQLSKYLLPSSGWSRQNSIYKINDIENLSLKLLGLFFPNTISGAM